MPVALVHDYLTQYGGAERVLAALHDRFPQAPVYTSLYAPEHLPAAFGDWDIHTSLIGHIPGAARTHRAWLPLYPAIFRQIGRRLRDVDLVISDSSAWSHHADPGPDVPHLCYCHSPARFLYGDRHYLGPARIPASLRPVTDGLFAGMQALDRRAARRVTHYVANSAAVAQRIHAAYGIEASVVYPPVETERFRPATPRQPEDFFLVVSRLVPHKRVDLAVRACTAADVPLKVIGDGRARSELAQLAGPSVELLGALDDAAVVDHLQRCRALILPGVEDFGMTAVEAQAAGRPVIALAGGGALETVIPGKTGLLFPTPTVDALTAALSEAAAIDWDTSRIQANAERFNRKRFSEGIDAVLGSLDM
jgi:glycosyltransferase involved in cell wall biosynthesis